MAGFGSVKLLDGGVQFSRGRGAAKVALRISTKEIQEWARRNAALMPKLVRRAQGNAANTLLQQLRKVMREGGGVYGVPKFAAFEPFTVELRALRGRSRSRMGGVLAEARRMTKWTNGRSQCIGWPDRMADIASKFQEGKGGRRAEDFLNDPGSRHRMHRGGIAEIPRQYVHKNRDVMRTFERHITENLRSWRHAVLEKSIAKQLAYAKGWVK